MLSAITGLWLSSGWSDLTGSEVAAFLQYTEQERGDSIGTRNCRLAALRSFFGFVAGREPDTAEQCAEVLRIPTKKAPLHAPSYLEPPEVEAILAQPDRSTLEGQRDHALLSFLYNTGARIQEALELRPNAIRLESPACVRLYGKGRKERLCPLWPETVSLLKALLQRQPRARRRNDSSSTAMALHLGPRAYASSSPSTSLPLRRRRRAWRRRHVTPHSFRHATAVHLVAAGVDITVIRSWLGHVSLDTTNHYAQANLETKAQSA